MSLSGNMKFFSRSTGLFKREFQLKSVSIQHVTHTRSTSVLNAPRISTACRPLSLYHTQKSVFHHSRLYSLSSTTMSPLNSSTPSPKKKKSVRDVASDDTLSIQPGSMISAPEERPSRVMAFSTAEAYEFPKLLDLLVQKYSLLPYLADDVYHIQLNSDHSHPAEAFFFDNGTFATWNASEELNRELVILVKQVEVKPYGNVETEWFDYMIDLSQSGRMSSELIVLGDDIPTNQAKLAYSSGMSHSVKLGSLESQLEHLLFSTRDIPQFFLQGKRVPFKRSYILKNLGELFALRAQVNLHSELLDSPDFCWSSGKMESYFHRISRALDVRPRIAVFNKKLDYANEVSEVLRNHLHEQHSLKLEWAIIILISVEIGFEVIHFLEGHGHL